MHTSTSSYCSIILRVDTVYVVRILSLEYIYVATRVELVPYPYRIGNPARFER